MSAVLSINRARRGRVAFRAGSIRFSEVSKPGLVHVLSLTRGRLMRCGEATEISYGSAHGKLSPMLKVFGHYVGCDTSTTAVFGGASC